MRTEILSALASRGWVGNPGSPIVSKGRVTMMLAFTSYRASLDLLLVPKDLRGGGLGNAAMRDLTGAADASGAALTLMVMPMGRDGPDEATLIRLYSAHGFVLAGKAADGEPLMNRAPRPAPRADDVPSGLDAGP